MLSIDSRGVVESGENDVVEEGWRLIRTAVIILARIIQTALNLMRKLRRLRTSGVGDSGLTVYDVEWCILLVLVIIFYFYRGSITLYSSFLRGIGVEYSSLVFISCAGGERPNSDEF